MDNVDWTGAIDALQKLVETSPFWITGLVAFIIIWRMVVLPTYVAWKSGKEDGKKKVDDGEG